MTGLLRPSRPGIPTNAAGRGLAPHASIGLIARDAPAGGEDRRLGLAGVRRRSDSMRRVASPPARSDLGGTPCRIRIVRDDGARAAPRLGGLIAPRGAGGTGRGRNPQGAKTTGRHAPLPADPRDRVRRGLPRQRAGPFRAMGAADGTARHMRSRAGRLHRRRTEAGRRALRPRGLGVERAGESAQADAAAHDPLLGIQPLRGPGRVRPQVVLRERPGRGPPQALSAGVRCGVHGGDAEVPSRSGVRARG